MEMRVNNLIHTKRLFKMPSYDQFFILRQNCKMIIFRFGLVCIASLDESKHRYPSDRLPARPFFQKALYIEEVKFQTSVMS